MNIKVLATDKHLPGERANPPAGWQKRSIRPVSPFWKGGAAPPFAGEFWPKLAELLRLVYPGADMLPSLCPHGGGRAHLRTNARPSPPGQNCDGKRAAGGPRRPRQPGQVRSDELKPPVGMLRSLAVTSGSAGMALPLVEMRCNCKCPHQYHRAAFTDFI